MTGPITTSTTAGRNLALLRTRDPKPFGIGHRLTITRTQEAYEKAVKPLFTSLDRAEAHLTKHADPYYFGANITEADIRLFTTIIRFDPVYVQHFKCNIHDIRSGYPALHKWLRKLYVRCIFCQNFSYPVPILSTETSLGNVCSSDVSRSSRIVLKRKINTDSGIFKWDIPAFKETTQFEHIKNHYTKSHKQINPYVRLLASFHCCALTWSCNY